MKVGLLASLWLLIGAQPAQRAAGLSHGRKPVEQAPFDSLSARAAGDTRRPSVMTHGLTPVARMYRPLAGTAGTAGPQAAPSGVAGSGSSHGGRRVPALLLRTRLLIGGGLLALLAVGCGGSDLLHAKVGTTFDSGSVSKLTDAPVATAKYESLEIVVLKGGVADSDGQSLADAVAKELLARGRHFADKTTLLLGRFTGRHRRAGPPERASAEMQVCCQLLATDGSTVRQAFTVDVKTDSVALEEKEGEKMSWLWTQALTHLAREISKQAK